MISILKQHVINLLLDENYSKKAKLHYLLLEYLTDKQHSKVKSSIVDINNCLNEVFPAFDRLHKELSSSFQLVDTLPDHISFHIVNCKNNKVKNAHLCNLNKIFEDFLSNSNTILVISDASIKNNIVTSILHIHSSWNVLTKTIHHVINITSTEAELFSIRCGIN